MGHNKVVADYGQKLYGSKCIRDSSNSSVPIETTPFSLLILEKPQKLNCSYFSSFPSLVAF